MGRVKTERLRRMTAAMRHNSDALGSTETRTAPIHYPLDDTRPLTFVLFPCFLFLLPHFLSFPLNSYSVRCPRVGSDTNNSTRMEKQNSRKMTKCRLKKYVECTKVCLAGSYGSIMEAGSAGALLTLAVCGRDSKARLRVRTSTEATGRCRLSLPAA